MPKFIKTFSQADKLVLQKAGYKLLSEDGDVSTFLNNSKLSFDKKEVKHICYTDVLSI